MIIFKVAIRITDPDTDLDLNPDGDAGKMALAEVCTVSMRLVFKCFLKMLFVMVALCNRADHYVFALRFLSFFFLSFFFFPRLISAVGDWMSTILPHMVWP